MAGEWYYWNDTATSYTADDCNSTTWTTWTITAADCTTNDAWNMWTSYSDPSHDPKVQERANALLNEVLTEAQRKEMAKHRYFTVESRTSKRRYRVHVDQERHGNIEELDGRGRVVAKLCCAPRGLIPIADALIGQKLSLEAAEDDFRRAANRTLVAA